MADRAKTAEVYRYQTVSAQQLEEESALPTECALAISYNDISYAVMMVSPDDVQDFVVGFSLTQGVIDSPGQFRSISVTFESEQGVADVQLSPRAQWQLKSYQRRLAGSSGCGICGTDALKSALPELFILPDAPLPKVCAFTNLRHRIREYQQALHSGGAQHAAFFVTNEGRITLCREDIGRHNAMDKLIGALTLSDTPLTNGFMVLTSRCGLELVQKAIRVGLPTLVTLSAPTTMAVEWAKRYQLNLIHLPHHSAPRVYHSSVAGNSG